jgi:hypothetical protein
MGDISAKSTQKQASQKQAKANVARQQQAAAHQRPASDQGEAIRQQENVNPIVSPGWFTSAHAARARRLFNAVNPLV